MGQPSGEASQVRSVGERIGDRDGLGNAGGLRVWMGVMGHQRETNHATSVDGEWKGTLENAVW